jgi:hypothetical protein
MGGQPMMHPMGQQMNPYMMNMLAMQQQQQQQQGMKGNMPQNMIPMEQPQQFKIRTDNLEFVNEIKKILLIQNQEERNELLGETIFYFLLHHLIPKYNLNISNGKFDDTILCSKLTGILLHTDETELLEIVSNTEILLMTIRDVIIVRFILI